MKTSFRLLAAGLAFAAVAAFAQPPQAPVRNVQDTYFGVTVDDPYRYMENLKDPEVVAWIRAQAGYARNVLDSIPGRADILKQLRAMDAATPARVSDVQRLPGGLLFYEKRGAKDDQFKLYRRQGYGGAEKLLVDPERLRRATGRPHAINYYAASPDGRHVAVGISESGSEEASIYVFDTRTGQRLGTPIDRARFGGISWIPDGSAFFYNRLRKLPPDAPAVEIQKFSQVFLHKLGTDAESDAVVVKEGTPGIAVEAIDTPIVQATPGSRWALAVLYAGTQREVTIYVAPLADAIAGTANWRRIVTPDDKVTSYAVIGDVVYLLTHRDSPRFSVVRASLASGTIAGAKTVVPPSELVAEEIGAARDALYVSERDGAVQRVMRVAHDESKPTEIALPFSGSAEIVSTDPRLDGTLIEMTGWTRSFRLYEYRANDRRVVDTRLYPVGKYDQPRDLVAREVKVKSHDGALVPLSIIHKKGVVLDGRNPTLLYGYGAYGITESALFTPTRLAWLDRGGIYAVANVRGSAVYGEEWYRAGFKATKPNTWKDFIACAQFLIDEKYTSSAKLGILGGSAGGILVGRAMTERPDLFAAVVSEVGVSDTIRMETTTNGFSNITEFGTVEKEDEFRALLAMSTYAHIRNGTPYPATLFTHGFNDPRVDVWESAKAAARLQAASTSGKPILLDVDYEAGHGIGSTKEQRFIQYADIYSFVFWQTGKPGFEPTMKTSAH
jgi:prolyl oligopeptidase